MRKMVTPESVCILVAWAFIWGSIGAVVGRLTSEAHWREVERRETRDYVNTGLDRVGFCRPQLLGTLVQQCLKKVEE